MAGHVWDILGPLFDALVALRLACLVIWLYIIIQTYQGKTVLLPIIGPMAQKQA